MKQVVIAKLGAPFGIKGWSHLRSFTNPANNILNFKVCALQNSNKDVRGATIEEIKPHGKDFVVKFSQIDDRDSIAKYTNYELTVDRIYLPELEEEQYYWADLIGMEVYHLTGKKLGVVRTCFATGANDVLVVKGENEEHLIPFVLGEYILDVVKEQNKITTSWDFEEID